MFSAYPSFNRYRPLGAVDPPQRGEDVYALQLALNHVGEFKVPLEPDGILGRKTGKAIQGVQRKLGLQPVDGIAGPATQGALALRLATDLREGQGLPRGLPEGQIAIESGNILGNYSPQRPDGSYDAGLCQRNTALTSPERGFDPVDSVTALVERVMSYWRLFEGLTVRRRWELACGSWNAPAFACHYARREGAQMVTASMTATPTPAAAEAFAAYCKAATAYLRL